MVVYKVTAVEKVSRAEGDALLHSLAKASLKGKTKSVVNKGNEKVWRREEEYKY